MGCPMPPDPPQPWAGFLTELDRLLEERIELHCIGGFAIVAAYGLPRSTNDIDYCSLVPYDRVQSVEQIAGEGSALALKHKVHLHNAGVAFVPENYESRLTEPFGRRFQNLRLLVLDPYDLVLSKLSRNLPRDREDVEYLARTLHLDPGILRERYKRELRFSLTGQPEWHDRTLDFWLDAYFMKPEA